MKWSINQDKDRLGDHRECRVPQILAVTKQLTERATAKSYQKRLINWRRYMQHTNLGNSLSWVSLMHPLNRVISTVGSAGNMSRLWPMYHMKICDTFKRLCFLPGKRGCSSERQGGVFWSSKAIRWQKMRLSVRRRKLLRVRYLCENGNTLLLMSWSRKKMRLWPQSFLCWQVQHHMYKYFSVEVATSWYRRFGLRLSELLGPRTLSLHGLVLKLW